jgi:hydroxylamine reductase (hybrid-cluster protein)
MKNKRQLIFRIAALAIVLVIAAAMFVVGRGHTIYFDNKTLEYNGQEYKAYHKVKVIVDGKEVAKLSERDRGMADIMGQTLTMTLEITDEKNGTPHSHKVSMGIPYNMDGIIINLPALMAGQPEEAYMSEFVITAPAEDTGDEEINTDEFDMGEEMGDI